MRTAARTLSAAFNTVLALTALSAPAAEAAEAWAEQKVSAADGSPGDNFGCSLAISGDTAVIGAYVATVDHPAQGAVYVYTRADGAWTPTQKLVAADGAELDQFGEAIALDGDTLLISANGAHVGGGRFAGAVYVFTRGGDGVWSETQKLTAGDAAEYDNFGWSVALSGTTALIGAPYADVAGRSDQGAAYVFSLAGGNWSEVAKLAATDGAADEHFGRAVAIEGQAALIGAADATVDGNAAQGATYAFDESGGVWHESQKLAGSGGAAFDGYGQAVAISGDAALIGAPLKEVAYVLVRADGLWQERQLLAGSDAPDNTRYFGYALDLEGAQAIVGAFDVDVDGRQYQGAAYVFDLDGGAWAETRRLVASDGAAHENFGLAVGISSGVALAGAYHAGVGAHAEQGAAYFYAAGDAIFADGFDGSLRDARSLAQRAR
ncbi:hypothetical protein [Dokdonella sp.]|uniref:hypothetical protein n=1 Tax=Dokdonella sp. TaxID=2291710 RepID=UPI001B1BED44|nr:hypothetical protein [Dokdonella sp.]MBO9663122.1 hypothetical protein [Dokdonella sp.]